jgi:hypothetical protein
MRRAVIGALVPVVLALAVMVGGAAVAPNAHAADQGDWTGTCYDRGQGCMWKGEIGASLVLASPRRDSYFSDDAFYGGFELQKLLIRTARVG